MSQDNNTLNYKGLKKGPNPLFYPMPSNPFTIKRGISSSDESPQIQHILIVDDDSSIANMLGDLLTEFGYEVLHASNGQEGLQMVESHSIDGILLDLEMPVMDGWTMLDELRWRNNDVPVVVMSGGVPIESMRSLLREGAQGILHKPVSLEVLEKKCFQIFGRPMREKASIPVCSSPKERKPLEAVSAFPIQAGGSR